MRVRVGGGVLGHFIHSSFLLLFFCIDDAIWYSVSVAIVWSVVFSFKKFVIKKWE